MHVRSDCWFRREYVVIVVVVVFIVVILRCAEALLVGVDR